MLIKAHNIGKQTADVYLESLEENFNPNFSHICSSIHANIKTFHNNAYQIQETSLMSQEVHFCGKL